MAVEVVVHDDGVHIRFTGMDRFMTVTGRYRVPMGSITAARVVPAAGLRPTLGWKLGGGRWFDRFATGWFTVRGRKGFRQLWCVYRDPEVLDIETKLSRPCRVVLQHRDRHDLAWFIGERLGPLICLDSIPRMFKALKRWWGYLTAKVSGKLDERADPKVLLEQAIAEAKDQHLRLRQQAANVIANQKQLEMQLSRTMGELEKANANTRQALVMASDASRSGDPTKAAEYNAAAESIATRLIELEKSVDEQKTLVLQATEAADQAKHAVEQNAAALQKKLSERQKLLSQLDQAKMQEELNKAMSTLSEEVGQDVPTFDEVRDKIEARYAKAKGMAELQGQTVDTRMREIEQAAANSEAQGRLASMRTELGLPSAEAPLAVEAPKAEAPLAVEAPKTEAPPSTA